MTERESMEITSDKRRTGWVVQAQAWLFAASVVLSLWGHAMSGITQRKELLNAILRYSQYAAWGVIMLPILRERRFSLKKAAIPLASCLIATFLPVLDSYGPRRFRGLLMLLQMTAFILSGEECQRLAFRYLRKMCVYASVLAIVCYASYRLSLPLPHQVAPYYIEGHGEEYVSYGIVFLHKQGVQIRLFGFCNEPGYWGTLAALLLCADGLNLRKKSNWIILLAGILTMSLAFFVMIGIYVLLLSTKKPKVFCAIVCAAVAAALVLPHVQIGNAAIDHLFARLAITKDGWVGDNRSNEAIDALFVKALAERPFFGFGSGYTRANAIGGLTYKIYVIDYGIAGFLLMYGSLLWGAIQNSTKTRRSFFYIIVFFASVYQRPNIFNLQYYLLLFGGLAHMTPEKIESAGGAPRPVKLVHFIHGLSMGGAETLVKDYALMLDKTRFDLTILCLNRLNTPYEKLLEEQGIKIIYISDWVKGRRRNLAEKAWLNLREYACVRRQLRALNPDVLHSHLMINSYVWFANLDEHTRLIHTIHSEITRLWNGKSAKARLDFLAAKRLAKYRHMRFITLHDRMRREADEAFHVTDSIVLNNGIDFSKYEAFRPRAEVRAEFEIPENAFVVGHVGRFAAQKNHSFLIDVFSEILRLRPDAYLLMVGAGDGLAQTQAKIEALGLQERCRITENRSDVPDLLHAMDAFVFPSTSEGLGIAAIEAQKAGVLCFASDAMPRAAAISNYFIQIPLAAGAAQWAAQIAAQPRGEIRYNEGVDEWDMRNVVGKLERIYLGEI